MNDAGRQWLHAESLESRVLVLDVAGKDGELTRAMLARAGIACVDCADAAKVCEQLTTGASAVLITEEAVHESQGCLAEWLAQQAPWSDLPVLVLARAGADSPAVTRAMEVLGNVTVIERPMRVAALVSAVRSAVRARQRQYQLRNERAQRERNAEQRELAMAAAHVGSWQLDLTSGTFSASARAIALYGLPPGTPLSHEAAMSCVHLDDRASVEAALRLAIETGEPFRHEHRVPQPDGSLRWLSSHAERQGEGNQACVIGLVQDVTVRKTAEERLQASEERFRFAAKALKGIIYEYNFQTGHVERSSGLYEVVGYRADEVPPTSAWWSEQIHPDDRGAGENQIVETMGSHFAKEYRVRHQDGRWLHVDDRAVIVRDDAGNIVKMVGCTVDVSARKQAEAANEIAQRQIHTTLESITDAFTRFDSAWRVVYMNDAAERLNQRPRAETLGRTLWEMFPALLGTQLETEYRRCVAEQVTIEFDYHNAPLESWTAIKCYPAPEGGLAVSIRDITDAKRAAAALRQSDARFRAGIEAISDIVWTNDASGKMAGEQVAWGKFTGQDSQKYQRYGWLGALHPDDVQPTIDVWNEAVAAKSPFAFEHRVRRRDGEWRLCTVRAVPVLDERGDVSEWVGVHNDITDRVQVDAKLQASEERLRMALAAAQAGAWAWDVSTNVITWSPENYLLYGYDPASRVPPAYADWEERVHPDDRGRANAAVADALAGRTSGFRHEFRVTHPARGERWLLGLGQVDLSPTGEARRLVGINLDITERKQAEQALAERTALLNGVLEGTSDVIFVKDLDGRCLLVNAAFAAAARSTPEQLTGKTDEDWFPPDVAAAVRQQDAAVVARGSPMQFEDSVSVAGEARYFLTLKAPLRDGNDRVVGVLGVGRDITERVETEAALRLSEERFRTLFESMDEGFCVIEMAFDEAGRATDYRTIEMNPAFEKQSGTVGLLGKWLRQALPDLEEFWYETYGRVATTGVATRFVHKAGPLDERWFDVNAFRLGGAGSNTVAVLFNDITASRLAQEAIMASEARSSFLVTLTDTLRSLSDPTVIQAEAGRVLGERLGASRVYYFEVGSDDYVVERDYTNAAMSMVGRYPITSFGPNPLAALRAGCTTSEADVDALLARTPEEKAAFAAVQIRSYIAVPLVKDGTFVAGLAVHAGNVRTWTPTEIAITEDTAERTWAAVERVRAQAALRVSEERRRLALEAAELGTWHVDPSSRLTQTDERFRAIFGTTDEWMDYLQLFAVMHPDDLPAVEAAVAAATRPDNPEPYAIEYRILRPDGALRWVFAKGRATFDGGETGRRAVRFDGTVLDITVQKQSELALRESEARLGGILRRSPAGIIQTDAAGCMTLVNPRWLEMTGFSEAELLGRNILDITHPSSVAPTIAAFDSAVSGGPDFQIEKAYRRKDGSTLHAQSNVAAIRSPSGVFLGLIAVILDISERLRSEEELRRLAAELSEADQRKDVFLATLAHELRNPLAPIRNGLQVMQLSENKGDAVEQVRSMMDRQVTQLVRLVDDLLDVSRITQGKVELRKERVDVRAVIEAALETSRPAIEQAGHKFAVAVPREPIFVDGDPTRLAQVVSNLLHNSAKYTAHGGNVRLSVWREGETAVVSIKDNGIGIPPGMLDKVFVMFAQVDRTLEKTTGGLGIGLSLVKGLLEMHGGTIEAKSDGEGTGTEFVFRLPVAMDVVAGPARPDVLKTEDVLTRQAAPSAVRRILVVDDNVDAADSLAQLLEMLGNEVRIATDGEAGIEVAAQFRPDMVLMDIGMPKLNGYDAARRIRQHPWSRGMVLVALTGWGQKRDRENSAEAGFDHHLVKPVEMHALTALISRLKGTDASDSGASTATPHTQAK